MRPWKEKLALFPNTPAERCKTIANTCVYVDFSTNNEKTGPAHWGRVARLESSGSRTNVLDRSGP